MSSFLIDSNILIYAADASVAENRRALEVIRLAGRSGDAWCLTWQNVFEYLSVVTNPRAFQGKALTFDEAREAIDQILEAPNLRLLTEGDDHWNALKEIVRGLPGSYGPFLYDCHLAAVLKQHAVRRIITADNGFKRFSFLSVINPFTQKELPF